MKKNTQTMPVHDLASFEVLSEDGGAVEQGAQPKGELVRTTATSWPAAVQALWLTPLPRIIVVRGGGESFTVVGGPQLAVRRRTGGGSDDKRSEVFRFKSDPAAPAVEIPDQSTWRPAGVLIRAPRDDMDASDLDGGAPTFECFWISGHKESAAGTAGIDRPFLAGNGSGVDMQRDPLESHRCVVRVDIGNQAHTESDLNLRNGDKIHVVGTLQIKLPTLSPPQTWLVYRCSGHTRLAEGGNGHHLHAYGWLLQRADNAGTDKLLRIRNMGDRSDLAYLGCFRDNKQLVDTRRAMPKIVNISHEPQNRVLACAQQAALRNKRLFSVQASEQCRVDDDESAAKRYGAAPDVGNESCQTQDVAGRNTGGDIAMALYRVDGMPAPYRLVAPKGIGWPADATKPGSQLRDYGLWNDNSDRRAMDHWRKIPASGAVLACATAAAQRNSAFFGLQGGDNNNKDCYTLVSGNLNNLVDNGVADPKKESQDTSGVIDELTGQGLGAGGDWTIHAYGMDDKLKVLVGGDNTEYFTEKWGPIILRRTVKLSTKKKQGDPDWWNNDPNVTVAERAWWVAANGRHFMGLNDDDVLMGESMEDITTDPEQRETSWSVDRNKWPQGNKSITIYEIPPATFDKMRLPVEYPLPNFGNVQLLFTATHRKRDAVVYTPPKKWTVAQRLQWAAQAGFQIVGLNDDDVMTGNEPEDVYEGPERNRPYLYDPAGLPQGRNGVSVYRIFKDTFDKLWATVTPRDVNTPWGGPIQWYGLWNDHEKRRALPKMLPGGVDQFPEKERVLEAARRAGNMGYRVFGIMSDGHEVWVGSNLIAARRNGIPFDGDGWARPFGGSWTMALYWLPDAVYNRLYEGEVTSGFDGGKLGYLGCYRDHGESRAMNPDKLAKYNTMVRCAHEAAVRGKAYFGIENGGDCSIRDDDNRGEIMRHGSLQLDDCGKTDDFGYHTGGDYSFSLYKMDPKYSASAGQYLYSGDGKTAMEVRDIDLPDLGRIKWHGMWQEEDEPRRNLPRKIPGGVDQFGSNAVKEATKRCAAAGKKIFGIMSEGHEVWIGDDLNAAKKNGPANVRQWSALGGHWVMALYQIPDDVFNKIYNGSVSYDAFDGGKLSLLGCFRDHGESRAMNPNPLGRDYGMLKCAHEAAVRGKKHFAIENGGDCSIRDDENREQMTRHGTLQDSDCGRKDTEGFFTGGDYSFSLYKMDDKYRDSVAQSKYAADGRSSTIKVYQTAYGPINLLFTAARPRGDRALEYKDKWSVAQRAKWAASQGKHIFGLNDNDIHLGELPEHVCEDMHNRVKPDRVDDYGWPMGGRGSISVYEIPDDTTYRRMRESALYETPWGPIKLLHTLSKSVMQGDKRRNVDGLSVAELALWVAGEGRRFMAINHDNVLYAHDPKEFARNGEIRTDEARLYDKRTRMLPLGTDLSTSKYVGCFKDSNDRRMTGFGAGFSREQCEQKARENGNRYFAIQFGNECFASNDWSRIQSLGTATCDMKDQQGREAGGGHANSVFDRTPETPSESKYVGCFKDSNDRRMTGFGAGFSREQCEQKAKETGNRYFAIQYGSECFASNDWSRIQSLGTATCDMKDKQGREAGGGHANSVFDRTPSAPAAAVGDDPGAPMGRDSMSVYEIPQATFDKMRAPKVYDTPWGPINLLFTARRPRGDWKWKPDGNVSVAERARYTARQGYHIMGLNHDDVHCGELPEHVAENVNERGTPTLFDPAGTGAPMGRDGTCSVYEIPQPTYDAMRVLDSTRVGTGSGDVLFHGMWRDTSENRNMDKILGPTSSVEDGARRCAQAGYKVVGIQAGEELRCGNDTLAATRNGPSGGPNTPLGTGWNMALYSIPDDTFNRMRGPKEMGTKYGTVHFHGMYRDDGGNRNLPRKTQGGVDQFSNPLEEAMRLVASTGKRVFGIELDGHEVWFGDNVEAAKRNGRATDVRENVRGYNGVMALFEMPEGTFSQAQAVRTFNAGAFNVAYLGCYRDKSDRAMNPNKIFTSPDVVNCALMAKLAKKKYFGLENKGDCSVRDDDDFEKITRYGPLQLSDCDSKDISGNHMGGDWSFALYKFT